MGQKIVLFMWGYQTHFRACLEGFAQRVLEAAGLKTEVRALLVGAQEPGGNKHPVCVEPERGPWPLSIFDKLEERIEALAAGDERNEIIYGDAASNNDKPKWIHASAVRKAILDRLAPYDAEWGVQSFAGGGVEVEGYWVVPILQIRLRDLERVPRLRRSQRGRYRVVTSLIDAVLTEVLNEATQLLGTDEPGRWLSTFERDSVDVLRSAGRAFTATPGAAADLLAGGSLFEGCNRVSALRYEGSEGRGKMVVARVGHPAVHVLLQFERAVPLRSANWARKILQMGSDEVALLCSGSEIYGLGRLCDAYDPTEEDAFVIDFVGHYAWELRHHERVLMRTSYATPKLPAERITEQEIRVLLRRIFGADQRLDPARIWSLVRGSVEQKHGTLLVVSDRAAEEAARLSAQATAVKPTNLSDALIRRVTGIDGAVLVDLGGQCHAIGVILDGVAVADGDPARGARFNSAMRYVANQKGKAKTVALVVSEDGHVNPLPLLRPLVRRDEVEKHVAQLHALADDVDSDWQRERNWLDDHRFYLNADQCTQVNADLEKLEAKVQGEAGAIWVIVKTFEPHPEMNDSFFE